MMLIGRPANFVDKPNSVRLSRPTGAGLDPMFAFLTAVVDGNLMLHGRRDDHIAI